MPLFISGYVCRGKKSRDSGKYFFTHVHGSFVLKHERMKATQMSFEEQKNKCGIFMQWDDLVLGKHKLWHMLNINDLWGYYVNWNRTTTKRRILYDCSYVRKYQKHRNKYDMVAFQSLRAKGNEECFTDTALELMDGSWR